MKFNYIHILLCFILVFQPVNFSQISVPGYDEFIPPPQLDPTNANIATPENVLIVYRLPRSQGDTMSFHIANYYKQVRNIPETNIIGLNLPLIKEINGHTIKMLFYDELIHDDDWIAPPNTTNHAWQYVQNFIMTPLQNHLDVTFVQG
ncbi:MAG: hypothetical protein KJN64_15230 [Ignavibacteria bacterium]|nr:hypothetical protein [Ignavibacteria bacterium]MBT8390516.1 hypothetical protein [Ignavibacteria bacterium]NNJ51788.1 hypothetical protein [Ignavibacteriaceae bacterium]NNL22796.1 hypothetical protein [Ignavibacteriaceae bacterium]